MLGNVMATEGVARMLMHVGGRPEMVIYVIMSSSLTGMTSNYLGKAHKKTAEFAPQGQVA